MIQTPLEVLVAVGLRVNSVIGEAGSFALLVPALWLACKSTLPVLVALIAFGRQPETSHASSHVPIAFALLIVAALWTRWSQRVSTQLTEAAARQPIRRSASR
jgi:hypothetical protein